MVVEQVVVDHYMVVVEEAVQVLLVQMERLLLVETVAMELHHLSLEHR